MPDAKSALREDGLNLRQLGRSQTVASWASPAWMSSICATLLASLKTVVVSGRHERRHRSGDCLVEKDLGAEIA
ncbi:MAG TPA: hypothetical protein VKC51_05750, partial [Lacunisphaera sp.]|nr:hypothetical protein [Lacunisphaera sp.]